MRKIALALAAVAVGFAFTGDFFAAGGFLGQAFGLFGLDFTFDVERLFVVIGFRDRAVKLALWLYQRGWKRSEVSSHYANNGEWTTVERGLSAACPLWTTVRR